MSEVENELINKETIKELETDLPREDFCALVEMFLQQSVKQLASIVEIIESDELQELKHLIHKEASSSLIFGLEEYGYYLRKIERDIDLDRYDSNSVDVGLMQDLMTKSHSALRLALPG